ncbi:putative polypeptide N-acetylgalactosaminyltransferase-like protein 1, partial [Clonorchis sinensis]
IFIVSVLRHREIHMHVGVKRCACPKSVGIFIQLSGGGHYMNGLYSDTALTRVIHGSLNKKTRKRTFKAFEKHFSHSVCNMSDRVAIDSEQKTPSKTRRLVYFATALRNKTQSLPLINGVTLVTLLIVNSCAVVLKLELLIGKVTWLMVIRPYTETSRSDRIAAERLVVSPIIYDISNPNELDDRPVWGGFTWNLTFRWEYMKAANRSDHILQPWASPAISGGIYATWRKGFFDLGGYDEEMDIWGAENVELSLRTWLCSGRMEIIPCSRVGHFYRSVHPYNFPQGKEYTVLRNRKRTALGFRDMYQKLSSGFQASVAVPDWEDLTDGSSIVTTTIVTVSLFNESSTPVASRKREQVRLFGVKLSFFGELNVNNTWHIDEIQTPSTEGAGSQWLSRNVDMNGILLLVSLVSVTCCHVCRISFRQNKFSASRHFDLALPYTLKNSHFVNEAGFYKSNTLADILARPRFTHVKIQMRPTCVGVVVIRSPRMSDVRRSDPGTAIGDARLMSSNKSETRVQCFPLVWTHRNNYARTGGRPLKREWCEYEQNTYPAKPQIWF